MNPTTLRLRKVETAVHEPVAWLVAGDAKQWLEEIARWKIDESRCEIFAIPRSRNDLTCTGALIHPVGSTPSVTPAGMAFGRVRGSVFLPIDAELLPALTDAELKEAVCAAHLIFHPAIGPIGYGTPLQVWDLIEAIPETVTEWEQHSQDTPPTLPSLASVQMRVPTSLDDLFGSAPHEIGTANPDDLPPSKLEQQNGPLRRMGQWLKLQGLRAAAWALGDGSGKPPPSWMQKTLSAIEAKMGRITQDMERLRQSALERLKEQLDSDPDEALKHALPLSSIGQHRGVAPPSTSLGTHSPNFNLGNLRGGRPIDGWHMAEEMRRTLREKYLALADRECRLGRFRRAAYIHAELLGDLAAAAAVLKQGGHWSEAAVIYRDHLRLHVEAAACFVEARAFDEAIKIYREKNEFEKLADLYARLGDPVGESEALHEWVNQLIQAGSTVMAADLLLVRLQDRTAALRLLENSWPSSPQARLCLERLCVLRGEAGEHAETKTLLRRVASPPIATPFLTPLLEVLGLLQKRYPDREVRALGEDLGRCALANLWDNAPTSRKPDSARLLAHLAPDDSLLARDAMRYCAVQRPAVVAEPPPPPRPPKLKPGETELIFLRKLENPYRGISWKTAVEADSTLYLAGQSSDGTSIVVSRANFDGARQKVVWEIADKEARPLVLTPFFRLWSGTIVSRVGAPAIPMRKMPRSDQFPTEGFLGTPPWLAEPAIAMASDSTGLWVLRVSGSGLVLSRLNTQGGLQQNIAIPEENLAKFNGSPDDVFHLGKCNDYLCLTWAHGAMIFDTRSPVLPHHFELSEPARALVCPARWANAQFAVITSSSVEVIWPQGDGRVDRVLGNLDNPVAGYTSDNTLVIIVGRQGYLVDCRHDGKSRMARFAWDAGTLPIAILAGHAARTFSVVTATGEISLWRYSLNDLR